MDYTASPAALTVRRLLIDLEAPIDRHWCGNDAFRTALFNALSMGFPPGEQMFIDSVRAAMPLLPEEKQAEFKTRVAGFIGQEATHRRIHGLFNAQLERHGLVNAWIPRAQRRLKRMEGFAPKHMLALTAAYEHFTALLAQWLLQHQDVFDGCEDRLTTLWLWHSAEEVEHKAVAFDLYQALSGKRVWRSFWFLSATLVFATDTLHQTLYNLKRDGTLWKRQTWTGTGSFLFGSDGVLRHSFGPWRAYLGKHFHPAQENSPLAERWLLANAGSFSVVQGRD
ncbi:metal-dependent hydrolase [Noviherbaspirillum sedimenti]|uniref:Metal-dependent hydrolase n=2 Tax=Noviherbaspirillum sedimenti TaxID=2320865 RepID=A0A3A3G8I3_9BURK|nr:metal-dependent hydrolase [Noviherbaspirillum sedimenti]